MTKKEAISDFLSQKRFALYGVSRNKHKFGNAILKELRNKGYELILIHPECDMLENDKCYRSLRDIPATVDGVILSIKPEQTEKVVKEINDAGIKRVWMQQGSGSPTAVELCKSNGISVIDKECILMFAEPAQFFHRFHRWIWGAIGRLPS